MIAPRDVKLRHLERDPRCSLAIFEAVAPFRGVEVRGDATLTRGDGVLLQLRPVEPRVWSLAEILPR